MRRPGKPRYLSRPSILARNNQPATILVGQSVPLITNVRYDTFGNAINSVSATPMSGIILHVTPFITSDGQVEMIVSPGDFLHFPDRLGHQYRRASSAPVIDKRTADTVVVTPDGQTVVIGGLIANRQSRDA
ncbi:MAG: hypothetical protein V9H26_00830 [Verrucomicrobiota bacterium]